jgi:hypothetical protein
LKPSERQTRSRKARAEAGGKQVSFMLSPAGYGALAKLLASLYAPTKQQCVEQALITAAKYTR